LLLSQYTQIYNILAIPTLSYGSEIWTLKQRGIRRLKTAEIKFMRCIAGYATAYWTGN
jgi:hypothetical protein